MTRKIIFFVAGFVVFVCGCTVILGAKIWLDTQQKIYISEGKRFWITCAIMMLVNFLALITTLGAFRSGAKEMETLKINQAFDGTSSESDGPDNTYRYSRRTVCFAIIISTTATMSPLIPGNSTSPLIAYLIGFLLSAISLPYAIYFARLYIVINSRRMMIFGFSTKKIIISDIASINYSRYKCVLETTIALHNQKKYVIIGTLKNHYQLADTLNALVGKGRWTSDDWWMTRHFKEVASRTTAHEATATAADKNKKGQ